MLGRLASIVAKLLLSGNKASLAFFLLHIFFVILLQSRGAEIKLPPGTEPNFGSGS
jgi:hypothetical protein